MAKGQHQEHEPATVMVKFAADGGTPRDFLSLPMASIVALAQKGVTRWEAEKAASASQKARKVIAGEKNIKAGDVKSSDISALYYDENAPRAAQWEAWLTELHAEFRDAALAGELGVSQPTVSQTEKDRIAAAIRSINEIVDARNEQRKAKGLKLKGFLMPHVRNEKNASDEAKAKVAQQNAEIDEANDKKIADFIADATSGGKFAPIYERHLAAVRAEREAARKEAELGKAEVSDSLDDDDMDLAAQ